MQRRICEGVVPKLGSRKARCEEEDSSEMEGSNEQ